MQSETHFGTLLIKITISIALILSLGCSGSGGGGGDGDSDNDGTESIAISDIEGLWTVYFTEDDAETANRMQVIYLMESDANLWCLVENQSEVNHYTATINNSNISFYWIDGSGQIDLLGVVGDDKMTGTWQRSNNESGTWEAVYGLDIDDPTVTIDQEEDSLLTIEFFDDYGTSIFYGTDPENGELPEITEAKILFENDELTIDADNDGRITSIIFKNIKVEIDYLADDSYSYEISLDDIITYSGVQSDLNHQIHYSDNRNCNHFQPYTTKNTLFSDRIALDEENDFEHPTLKDGLEHSLIVYTMAAAPIPWTDKDDPDWDHPFFIKMYECQEYTELFTTMILLAEMRNYLDENKDIVCQGSVDNKKCLARVDAGIDFLKKYTKLVNIFLQDIIMQKYEEYINPPIFSTNLTNGPWTIILSGDDGNGIQAWWTWHTIEFQGSETDGILHSGGTNLNGTYHVSGNDIEFFIEYPGSDERFDFSGSFSSVSQMGGTWTTPFEGFYETLNFKQWIGTWNNDG